MTRLDRCDGGYVIAGRKTGADDLLDTVMKLDDELGGSFTLTAVQNEALGRLFAGYVAVPDFTEVSFMEASSALFSYLAESGDDVLASQVARAMGWMSQDEHMARIRSSAPSSESYRAYWRTLAQEVLTYEGFDDFRFGSVKMDGCGTYLYDGEKAVCYIEVSRDGDELRHAVISLTLLGNPEAVDDEEGERQFEWCCFFDDEIGAGDGEARILGGRLRTIDPYGASSLVHRRYDIVYDALDAPQLALVTRSLVRMLESYPPKE